jgi:hypothetical protein
MYPMPRPRQQNHQVCTIPPVTLTLSSQTPELFSPIISRSNSATTPERHQPSTRSSSSTTEQLRRPMGGGGGGGSGRGSSWQMTEMAAAAGSTQQDETMWPWRTMAEAAERTRTTASTETRIFSSRTVYPPKNHINAPKLSHLWHRSLPTSSKCTY